ncbi:ApeA N-terminal domain 1-containing protein [Pseudomonas sp. SDO52101_S400]
MKNNFDFSKKFEYDVEVYDDTRPPLGEGRLSFGESGLICIHFNFDSFYKASQKTHSVLKAKSKAGQIFTLFNCTFESSSLYADFIVIGEIRSEITYFHVKYGDVSDWFLRGQHITGQIGESLNWNNPAPHLSVNIKTPDENFSLKTETFGSLTKLGEDHVIHEHIRFIFERLGDNFSIDEVKEKSFEVSTLLSVLLANPVSIANAWVGCDGNYPMPIYFSAFKKVDRGDSSDVFWLRCFTQRHSLNDKWQLVFDRYYSSPFRKSSWVRLAGMQRYEGFWEFKILGYVSLMDEYVSTHAAQANQKTINVENKKAAQFINRLKKLKHPLDDAQFNDVKTLAESIFLASRELNFREKYDFALSLTNKDILKVINLTDDDFSSIKRIRDKIAHGNAPDLADTSYQEIHFIIEKIALLMTYWAHADLGFSHSEFASALMLTHNHLHFNPKLDSIFLKRITNSATFINVSKELFDKFPSVGYPIINACFTQSLQGELKYSAEYQAMYDAWINDRGRKGVYVIDAFGIAPDRFISAANLFLECGEEIKELHMAYIIMDA